MLERLAGNAALKSELGAALRAGRLPHAILLVGEPGCGAGFAARCLAADYLYPQGGAHAEAVLNGTDTECVSLRGSGKSGGIPVDDVRAMREKIQHSALSTDAAGRVMFIYGAQNLNGTQGSAANAAAAPPTRSRPSLPTSAALCWAAGAYPRRWRRSFPFYMRGISARRCRCLPTPTPAPC